MRYIRVISGVVAALVFAATASAGPIEDKAQGTVGEAESGNVDVAIDISEKAFHVTKGGTERGFTLIAGTPTVIELRNRDLVAHEFMSTLFRDVPFRISGNATLVKTARATGVRGRSGNEGPLSLTPPWRRRTNMAARNPAMMSSGVMSMGRSMDKKCAGNC